MNGWKHSGATSVKVSNGITSRKKTVKRLDPRADGSKKSIRGERRAPGRGVCRPLPEVRRSEAKDQGVDVGEWFVMAKQSYWIRSAKLPHFPKLASDVKVDVAVVGGGITGVTAAYLLKKAGRTVATVAG